MQLFIVKTWSADKSWFNTLHIYANDLFQVIEKTQPHKLAGSTCIEIRLA